MQAKCVILHPSLQSLLRKLQIRLIRYNASAQKGKADSVGNLLKQVVDAAYAANEVARNIENEIAYQREITDEAKNALKA